jgi:hypothetical protein
MLRIIIIILHHNFQEREIDRFSSSTANISITQQFFKLGFVPMQVAPASDYMIRLSN